MESIVISPKKIIYKIIPANKNKCGPGFSFSEGKFIFGRGKHSPLKIQDPTISREHFCIEVTAAGIFLKDLDSKNATFVNEKRIKSKKIINNGDRILAGRSEFIFFISKSPEEIHHLRGDSLFLTTLMQIKENTEEFAKARKQLGDLGILGQSRAIKNLKELIKKVAQSDATVLITGESGTGKELVASAIHHMSSRHGENFCAVNCAAIPEELMESEFFGHHAGAFTGATTNKIGKFQFADKGTLFLDEIGDLPITLQAGLLRAVEEKEIVPLGSNKARKCDTRIIAATNLDLEKKIHQKEFRSDLFFRLNIISIKLPPLQARKEDIPIIFRYYLSFFEEKYNISPEPIKAEDWEQLCNYSWPGNIRELKNICERYLILGEFPTFKSGQPQKEKKEAKLLSLKEVEKRHIFQVLDAVESNKSRACEILGIKRSTLYEKLKQYSIQKAEM
ncbi:sigma 54-interacting transcriptional regulator [Candidatus Riflebacteria bacterium]